MSFTRMIGSTIVHPAAASMHCVSPRSSRNPAEKSPASNASLRAGEQRALLRDRIGAVVGNAPCLCVLAARSCGGPHLGLERCVAASAAPTTLVTLGRIWAGRADERLLVLSH